MGVLDVNSPYKAEQLLRAVFAGMHTMLIMPFSKILGRQKLPTDGYGAAAFLTKALMANTVISTAQALSVSIEALVSEALFVFGKFLYYKFLLNPQNVTITHSKLQNVSEASDITIINTYRNTAATMSIRGISGSLLPRDFMSVTGAATKLPTETLARYPKLSAAWFKFRQLEKFYNEVNSDIVIMYDMDLYIGKFVSFNYSQEANNPWVINYDMQFKIYPAMILHSLSIYDYSTFFTAMVERYGKTFATDFEGKSVTIKEEKQ